MKPSTERLKMTGEINVGYNGSDAWRHALRKPAGRKVVGNGRPAFTHG